MEKKTIFETLKENNICYSVGVAFMSLKSNRVDFGEKDYYIMVHNDDLESLKGFRFYNNQQKSYNVSEYSLTKEDLLEFKSIQNKFNKVHSDESGRVYELKSNSFKNYYSTKN